MVFILLIHFVTSANFVGFALTYYSAITISLSISYPVPKILRAYKLKAVLALSLTLTIPSTLLIFYFN